MHTKNKFKEVSKDVYVRKEINDPQTNNMKTKVIIGLCIVIMVLIGFIIIGYAQIEKIKKANTTTIKTEFITLK